MSELGQLNLKSLSHFSKPLGVPSRGGDPAGGAQKSSGTDLASWYEDAEQWWNWYQGVQSGAIPLQQGEKLPSEMEVRKFLEGKQWAAEELGISGQWDPMAADKFDSNSLPMAEEANLPAGAKKGTLNNITWTGPKAELTFDGDVRAQDIWSKDIILNVSDLSVDVKTSITTDTRWHPPTSTLKVVMTDSATGKESVYFIHDYDKKKKHLIIRTPEENEALKKQVDDINAKMPGLVSLENFDPAALGSEAETKDSVPAPELINGERVWKKGNAVEYYLTPGKEKDKIHLDAIDFNIPDRTYQVQVTKTDAHNYTIKVFDPQVSTTEPIRTIETDQTDTLNFKGIDAGNLSYRDLTSGAKPTPVAAGSKLPLAIAKTILNPNGSTTSNEKPFIAWDQFSESPDVQVKVEGHVVGAGEANSGQGKKPGEPLHEGDTPPDPNSLANGEVTYTGGNSNIEIHADLNDGVNTYRISTTGDVLLHGINPSDKVEIIKRGPTQAELLKGSDKGTIREIIFTSSDGTKKKFIIQGEPSNIILDTTSDKVTGQEQDLNDFVFKFGKGFEVNSAPPSIQNLLDATGADEETLLQVLWRNYPELRQYDGIGKGGNNDKKFDLNELSKAISKGFTLLPADPTTAEPEEMQRLVELIAELNPKFANAVNAATGGDANKTPLQKASRELVRIFQLLFADQINPKDIKHADPNHGDWVHANDILIDGRRFHFTKEEGDTTQIQFQWLTEK